MTSVSLNTDSQELTHSLFDSYFGNRDEPPENGMLKDAWVAQPVEHPTPDAGSGHNLMVGDTMPCAGPCTDSMGPAGASLPPIPCLSLKINFKKTMH